MTRNPELHFAYLHHELRICYLSSGQLVAGRSESPLAVVHGLHLLIKSHK